ncbi:endo-1,4-beta-glycosidase [Rathayibacter sp. Leaf299]|uniref:endo-1,4-beta-xylanase n=1 Tax=Rathayibacter sp. Leaf299 TaxID=1736328 RepID=UPI0006F45212|nr:endo-1,4-beta-xylanase [Rathayibacter sp. Leaf299]KQQ18656.1 endo-1,4-beta-glycosidase [Rathayibacter sp. Leaf299]
MRTLKSAAIAATVALGLTLTAAVPATAVTDSGPTLRELAESAGLTIGSGSIKAAEWTTDGRPSNYLAEPEFADTLSEQFNGLSPENEMKWLFTQPEKGVYDFAGLDRLVAFAEQHDMAVKGHGLISSCCDPEYVTQITDPDEMRAAMTEHFTTLMQRYDGKIDRWDVVSEALESQGTALQPTTFYKVLGPGYIADAFRIARAADPNARLFINENLVEFDAAKRQAFLDLLTGLVADGVPIDGVALQMHETLASPVPGVITEMVNSYRALGLDVEIAELDAHTYDPAQQAQIYGDVVAEALAAGVTEISTWGFTDKHLYTWLPGSKPLIFDEEYNPKPAYFAFRDALQQFVEPTSAPGVASLTNTGWKLGLSDGNYDIKMNLRNGAPGSYYRLYENDVLVSAQRLDSLNDSPQSATTSFSGKTNGKYKYRAELINSQGVTSTKTTTVLVKNVAPSKPVVTADNRDGDGSFVATATLKWGINATSYAFKLDGQVVGEGTLKAATPNKQTAQVSLTGIASGQHKLTVVFTNTGGSTESKPVTVTVR